MDLLPSSFFFLSFFPFFPLLFSISPFSDKPKRQSARRNIRVRQKTPFILFFFWLIVSGKYTHTIRAESVWILLREKNYLLLSFFWKRGGRGRGEKGSGRKGNIISFPPLLSFCSLELFGRCSSIFLYIAFSVNVLFFPRVCVCIVLYIYLIFSQQQY
ncbi:hypothetical protein L228DRAFT_19468 [Xylona heveae TC161]|uniref:Uncharacterized protein n=1 Tax=Xylona heveae (strain CBS 132557 / TC161) TaxID=1328760 RepID=A0A165K061_XYLHT|nr:hypothetical protein L228DRAFT_19468 [Xylona heveae TC161]KZF26840.1 hypothetical protein L228DRAFT_19468 [Xylona heveae TC161]